MRIGVAGGGVVGLATAYYLRKLGADPVVVEAGTAGGGCSRGNAGWVCPSISTPLPAPGLTWTSLLGMLRPDSPLYIKATAVPWLAPWLMRFRSHCTKAAQEHGIAALATLNAVTMERYDEMAADGVGFESARSGVLMAFRDSAKAAGARAEVEAVAAAGAASYRELDQAELHDREPMLRPGFNCGVFVDAERHVRPETLTAGLARALRAGGVDVHEGTSVTGLVTEGRRVRALATTKGDMGVDAVVLAAGAETGVLARMAGLAIPLTAGKGYSVTVERPVNQLRQPLYLGGAKVGLTPFDGALRFAGTMELSGVNRRMDRARVRSLRRVVGRDVDIPEAKDGGTEWVGMRPMVPDTLPVVGRVPLRENVYVNTGHQMLGVTLAPGSGWALAGLIVEGRAGVDLEAFSAGRF